MSRRALALAVVFGWLIAAITFGTGVAKASPETDYLDGLNGIGLVVYDTSQALNTGYQICTAFNTANGEIVAQNLYTHTTFADVPDLATAQAWVVIAGTTLCPWHFHPERVTANQRLV